MDATVVDANGEVCIAVDVVSNIAIATEDRKRYRSDHAILRPDLCVHQNLLHADTIHNLFKVFTLRGTRGSRTDEINSRNIGQPSDDCSSGHPSRAPVKTATSRGPDPIDAEPKQRHDGQKEILYTGRPSTTSSLLPPGSLRNIASVMSSMKGHHVAGPVVGDAIRSFIARHPSVCTEILQAVAEKKQYSMGHKLVSDLSATISASLDDLIDVRVWRENEAICTPVDEYVTTPIDGILYKWALAARDQTAPAALWLFAGAPAGIMQPFDLGELLEEATPQDVADISTLTECTTGFANHGNFDTNPKAAEIVHDMVKSKGWLK